MPHSRGRRAARTYRQRRDWCAPEESATTPHARTGSADEGPGPPLPGARRLRPGVPAYARRTDAAASDLQARNRWRHDGKLRSALEERGPKYTPTIGARYAYDAQGNRLRKATYAPAKGTDEGAYAESGTVHLRDAAGQVLATYRTARAYQDGIGTPEGEEGQSQELRAESGAELDVAYLAEVPLYGSSRVGLRRYGATGGRVVLDNRTAIDAPPAKPTDGWRYVRRAAPVRAERERGGGVYEVSNHLSNVLTTVADYRATVAGGAFSGVTELAGVRGYVPGAREEHDYYPFGLPVPDAERGTVQRDVASLSYRYSFNGKEDDASLAGAGVAQDYGFRLYNKASARFMSVDPLAASYPWYTPYQFAGNTPIQAVDLDGKEIYFSTFTEPDEYGNTQLQILDRIDIISGTKPTIIPFFDLEESINLKEAGIEYNFIYYDCAWRLVPDEYLNQSLQEISEEDWAEFKTLEEIDAAIGAVIKLGELAEAVVDVATMRSGGSPTDAMGARRGFRKRAGRSNAKPNPYRGKSRKELDKAKKSQEDLIQEHRQKLEDFKKDPIGNTDQKRLEQMTRDNPTQDELLRRARGREGALEKQLRKQEGELDKINNAIDELSHG